MLKITDRKNLTKPFRILAKIRQYFNIKKAFKRFKKISDESGTRFPITWDNIFFISGDNTTNTSFDAHYVYHPAWAARILAETKPEFHIDISSTLHFCSIVSAFLPVKFYDYRPARLDLSNLISEKTDLLALPFPDKNVKSISCMHTIEHVGLGRYGDQIDPNGDLKAIKEIERVIASNGDFLFVVPVGKPKIMFNAHRIYSYSQIMKYFTNFELKNFFLIPDDAMNTGIINNATEEDASQQNYGCGCFWFRKK